MQGEARRLLLRVRGGFHDSCQRTPQAVRYAAPRKRRDLPFVAAERGLRVELRPRWFTSACACPGPSTPAGGGVSSSAPHAAAHGTTTGVAASGLQPQQERQRPQEPTGEAGLAGLQGRGALEAQRQSSRSLPPQRRAPCAGALPAADLDETRSASPGLGGLARLVRAAPSGVLLERGPATHVEAAPVPQVL
jgi:hypothetical protein